MSAPKGQTILAVPIEPEYTDEEHRAIAKFDFLSYPGPICRLDFEGSRIGDLTIEQSLDGKTFTSVQTTSSKEPGGVQGPVMLKQPVRARYLRVTGAGGTEPPMLRNVQAAALKVPCAASVVAASGEIALKADFKDPAWPRQPVVVGFTKPDGSLFAQQPCELRLCHTANTLVAGLYARDTRMATAVANAKERDGAVVNDESFEIVIRVNRGEPLRFVINTLGTQFDAKGARTRHGTANGRLSPRATPTGWAATVAIPYSTIGIAPASRREHSGQFHPPPPATSPNDDTVWAPPERKRTVWPADVQLRAIRERK